MTESHEELLEIADRLERLAEEGNASAINEPLEALKEAANQIGKSWGGSWLGYHANVYYAGLETPPPGAHFSQEWGLMDTIGSLGSYGDWREFNAEAVKEAVYQSANNPDLAPARGFAREVARQFDADKSEILSILSTELANSSDPFLSRLKDEVDDIALLSAQDIARLQSPKGQMMTRDTIVLGQGNRVPPHISVLSDVLAIQHTFGSVANLGKIARKAGSHLSRQRRQRRKADIVGTNVFIGHGGSHDWRDLKDFIQDRLALPWDEFNRVPVAGVTNIQRLSEMLDSAVIAFLVMTGEDEQKDGKLRARMNVIHEAGLFQGRLGFSRAIVLLEEGCEEFSNIEGLGQIRFPKGKIKVAFEEIRRVLEREGIVPPP
jgi:predicted nucleotide-binding protein